MSKPFTMQFLSLRISISVFTIAAKLPTLCLLFFPLYSELFPKAISLPRLNVNYMETNIDLSVTQYVLSIHACFFIFIFVLNLGINLLDFKIKFIWFCSMLFSPTQYFLL